MTFKKLKSVHLTNYYHKNSGGISTVYNRLLEEANSHEREVRLIVPGEFEAQEEVGKFGRIYYVKAKQSPIFDKRYRLIMPWDYFPLDSGIRRILEDEMPDIIEIADKYTLSYLAGLIKKGGFGSLNRPMLVHLCCERMDDNLRSFVSGSKPFRWLSRNVMGNCVAPMFDYHLANSDYTAGEMLDAVAYGQNGNGSSRKENFSWRYFNSKKEGFSQRVVVSNCGVDNEIFHVGRKNKEKREKLLAEAGFPDDSTVLLYVGRLSPEKNIGLLLDVFRSLDGFQDYEIPKCNYRLLIAGDGPKADWIKQELEKSTPGKFKMLGHLGDKEKLADLYANADMFIHPNAHEPFGIAPLEAMASGTPVIAPNAGGVLSYANNENAWLKNPDSDSFFAAVKDISINPRSRAKKVKAALETAENFTWEKAIERQFRLYDQLHKEFKEGLNA